MKNAAAFVASLSHAPGVYQMLDAAGKVLYIGKARDLKKRLGQYFSSREKDIKTAALLKHVTDITITLTADENAALLLECNLIKQLKPHYNVLFRDDKSYPYILITGGNFPRILFHRISRKSAYSRKKSAREGQLFGPFADAHAVRETITLIEKIFRLRNCTDTFFAARKRPCIQYQIARCTAPCVNFITAEKYAENVRLAVLFLQGKNTEILQALADQMENASRILEYEKAARHRDQIVRLREIQSTRFVNTRSAIDAAGFAFHAGVACIQLLMIRHGRMSGSRAFFPQLPGHADSKDILASFVQQFWLDTLFDAADIPVEIILPFAPADASLLQKVLSEKAGRTVLLSTSVRGERKKWLNTATHSARQSLATKLAGQASLKARLTQFCKIMAFPYEKLHRIECIDISHTMGEATVGSCVVFGKEGPLKSEWRRYNIRDVSAGNDTAAIEKMLNTRYGRISAAQEKKKFPDILLIDGGLPQLHAAENEVKKTGNAGQILLLAVAKGRTRKPGFETLYFTDRKPLHLPPDSQALHFIQQIRDEAHRFAITRHRLKRDRQRTQSILETVPGIGAKRRREILRHFGGIKAISRASVEDIAKVPGISRMLAQKIHEMLHR